MSTVRGFVIGVLVALSVSLAAQQVIPLPNVPGFITPSFSSATNPSLSGQWTVNGSLCAAGQVVQGGSPTICTATPSVTNISLGNGTAAAPSLTFASKTNTGITMSATSDMPALVSNGVIVAAWRNDTNGAFVLAPTFPLGFSTGTPGTNAPDVYLRRSAAKTLTLDTDGVGGALALVDVKGPLTSNARVTALRFSADDTSSGFATTSRGNLSFVADGVWQFLNNATTAGVRIDFGTLNGTLNVLSSAGADTAILKANTFAATGTATSGGLTPAGTVGHPVIVAYGNVAAATNTGTASIATITPGVDTTYEVGCNILVTTSTTHSFSCDVTYTDEGNVARTMVLPMTQLAGTFVTTGLITNTLGAGPYSSPTMNIRAKASTAVTIRTSAGGTFTTVVYNARGTIKQVS